MDGAEAEVPRKTISNNGNPFAEKLGLLYLKVGGTNPSFALDTFSVLMIY
jgi:hypothetical protein